VRLHPGLSPRLQAVSELPPTSRNWWLRSDCSKRKHRYCTFPESTSLVIKKMFLHRKHEWNVMNKLAVLLRKPDCQVRNRFWAWNFQNQNKPGHAKSISNSHLTLPILRVHSSGFYMTSRHSTISVDCRFEPLDGQSKLSNRSGLIKNRIKCVTGVFHLDDS